MNGRMTRRPTRLEIRAALLEAEGDRQLRARWRGIVAVALPEHRGMARSSLPLSIVRELGGPLERSMKG